MAEFYLAPIPASLRVQAVTIHRANFTSNWLISEENGVMLFKFGKTNFSVDLNIQIDDGSLLTANKNRDLLECIKNWIHIQHYPKDNKLNTPKSRTAKKQLWDVLRSIDMMILNGGRIKLAECGFSHISEGDLNLFKNRFLVSNNVHESIYDWPEKLGNFLKSKIQEISDSEYTRFFDKYPIFLEPVLDSKTRAVSLNETDIFKARAWLYKNNYYASRNGIWPGHVRTNKLAQIIYPNCLMTKYMRPLSYELEIQAVSGYRREHPNIPVRQEQDSSTKFRYTSFCDVLLSQREIPHKNKIISPVALETLNKKIGDGVFANVGHYTTLPHKITLNFLKKAVLFFDEYSESTFTTLSDIARSAYEAGITPEVFFKKNTIPRLNTTYTIWSLKNDTNTGSPDTKKYYSSVRKLKGALQSYYILLGSIQYAVGYLTARRQAELLNLKFKNINFELNYMTVYLMKTGIGDTREPFDVTLIPLVNRMLQRLKQFHLDCGLTEAQVLTSFCFGRFSLRRKAGVVRPTSAIWNSHLDIFSDYFESPLIENRRHYPRQHQLRRAFALAFFYLNKRSSLATLTYYFGHTNFKQIWRYLTSTIAGSELLEIRATFLAAETTAEHIKSKELMKLLYENFKCSDLHVIGRERLESYYKHQIKSGKVDVSPKFLEFNGQQKVLVAIRVSA